MGDLMRHRVGDDAPEARVVMAGPGLVQERPFEKGDPVGQDACVPAVASVQRDTFVEAEQGRSPRRRVVLDDDLDVVEPLEDPCWEGVDGLGHQFLEALAVRLGHRL